jgi:hypothetical protein
MDMTTNAQIEFFTVTVNDFELKAAIDFEERIVGLTHPEQVNAVLEKATANYTQTTEVVDDNGNYILDNEERKDAISWIAQDILEELKETVKIQFNIVLKDENYIESEGIDFRF